VYQKSYAVLSRNYKRKVVIKVWGNIDGPINLSDWLVDKRVSGIRPVDITSQCLVKSGCLVFLEPLSNGDSIVTVLGP